MLGADAPTVESGDDPRKAADDILELLMERGSIPKPGKTRVVVLGPGDLVILGKRHGPGDGTTEEDQGSFTGVRVTLASHLKGVGERAREFAQGCGLPPELISDLQLAGFWHDAGKADPARRRACSRAARSAAGTTDLARYELVAITSRRATTASRESIPA